MTPVVRVSPAVVWEAIRVGRMTALKEADGGVWGIVVGDFLEEWLRAPSHNSVPFPLSFVDQGKDRVCQSHSPDIDGHGCQVDHPLSRRDLCFRPRAPQLDVVRFDGDG